MKEYSIALTMTGLPSSLPRALMTASFSPVSSASALQPIGVRLQIGELQRVGGDQIVIFDFVLAVVEQVARAGCARQCGSDGRIWGTR